MRAIGIKGCVLVVLACRMVFAQVVLVQDGAPKAVIRLGGNPTDAEKAAATDLQDYIRKMSGAELPIDSQPGEGQSVISILGPSSDRARREELLKSKEALEPEGFAILSDGARQVQLIANDDAGIRFAANAFLEELGVRWFMPCEIGEVVPQCRTISFPEMGKVENPDFILRNVWYGYGGRPNWQKSAYAEWRMRNKMGGVHAAMSHNLFRIVPQKTFGKTHPEYYPEVGGVRLVPKEREGHNWQPCTSNPEVVRLAIEAARAYFDKNPDAYSFSLSPNDGYGWCECKACRALDPPERNEGDRRLLGRRMVVFSNAVAEELQKTHPGKCVAFYAYAGTLEPPTDLKVHPNVIIPIAHYGWGGCNIHRLQHPNCENNTKFRKVLQDWAKVADSLFIREYWTVITTASRGPNRVAAAWSLADDIPFFKKNNVRGFSSESIAVWGIAGLNFYLSARLMWDSSLDLEALLNDYFNKFYGPAGPLMRKYFTTCRDKARARAHTKQAKVTDADLDEAEATLKEAHAACATDRQRERVKIAQNYLRYCRAVRTYGDNPIRKNREALSALAKELSESNAIDYTVHKARFEKQYRAADPARAEYTGGPLRPLSTEPAGKLPELSCRLRGLHGWGILAKAGEHIKADIKLRRLGRYFSAAGWILRDPDGKEVKSGTAYMGEPGTLDVAAEKDGTYVLFVNSGRNAADVRIENRYHAIWGATPHFLGKSGRLYFHVPKGTTEIRLRLETGSPGETGTMTIYTPDGAAAATGDTTKRAVYAPVVPVPAGQDGRAWSFEITAAPTGVCEDNMVTIDPRLPPFLSPSPKMLVVPAR